MGGTMDALHAARVALLEGALLSLLREIAGELDANTVPDGVTARLGPDGLDLEYTRGAMPVAGEGV